MQAETKREQVVLKSGAKDGNLSLGRDIIGVPDH